MDIDFILGIGKCLSLVICMVFIEGVVASRVNAKWYGLILPTLITVLSLWIFAVWGNFIYFILVFGPALLCWFIYFMCRRSIKNGTALTMIDDEEQEW